MNCQSSTSWIAIIHHQSSLFIVLIHRPYWWIQLAIRATVGIIQPGSDKQWKHACAQAPGWMWHHILHTLFRDEMNHASICPTLSIYSSSIHARNILANQTPLLPEIAGSLPSNMVAADDSSSISQCQFLWNCYHSLRSPPQSNTISVYEFCHEPILNQWFIV